MHPPHFFDFVMFQQHNVGDGKICIKLTRVKFIPDAGVCGGIHISVRHGHVGCISPVPWGSGDDARFFPEKFRKVSLQFEERQCGSNFDENDIIAERTEISELKEKARTRGKKLLQPRRHFAFVLFIVTKRGLESQVYGNFKDTAGPETFGDLMLNCPDFFRDIFGRKNSDKPERLMLHREPSVCRFNVQQCAANKFHSLRGSRKFLDPSGSVSHLRSCNPYL